MDDSKWLKMFLGVSWPKLMRKTRANNGPGMDGESATAWVGNMESYAPILCQSRVSR